MLIKFRSKTTNNELYLNTNKVVSVLVGDDGKSQVTLENNESYRLSVEGTKRLLNFMEYIDEHDKERGPVYPVEGGNNTG
jgi:hypothetical protein